jgi:hypothetical protein
MDRHELRFVLRFGVREQFNEYAERLYNEEPSGGWLQDARCPWGRARGPAPRRRPALIGGGRLRGERLPPEPCAPTNAEARLHGTVFFAVLPRRPDEHAADEDERDEQHHEEDDLCSRHCNRFTAKPRLAAEPLSEQPPRTSKPRCDPNPHF